MKKAVRLFVFFLSFASASGLARATSPSPEQFEPVPVRPGKGLLDAMTVGKHIHCDQSQLTAVMKYNDISPEQLHHLQPGQLIRLPSWCQVMADPEVATQSRVTVASENNQMKAMYVKTIQDLQKQVVILEGKLAEALSAAAQNPEVVRLNQRVKYLEDQNSYLTKQLGLLPGTLRFRLTIGQKINFLCTGLFIASFCWGTYVVFVLHKPATSQRHEEFPDELTHNDCGRRTTLKKVCDALYQCSCGVGNLELHSIPRHFRVDHVADRLEESETVFGQPVEVRAT